MGFAGFAGVIGAFSHFRIHAQATAFRVRAMVAAALMEVLFALLPSVVAGFGVGEVLTWRICCGAVAVATSVLLLVSARRASILYRMGRLFRIAAYALSAVAAALIAPLIAAALGFWVAYASAFYFAMLFFGMFLCAYHFLMLMIAVELDASDAQSAPKPAKARARRRSQP